MENDPGGLLWLVINVGMVAALGIALAYGAIKWANRRTDPETREAARMATERVYRQAEEQDRRELPS
jgi:hypothetical protein